MLPRLICLLPLLFACSFAARAQAFEPGLLVSANGDTLRGEIENNFWVEPPTFIRYRPTPGSSSQLFQPQQLRAVIFANGRYYKYEILPIDHAADTRPERMQVGSQSDIQRDSLLAEVIVEGTVSLFQVVQPGSVHFLLRRPGQPVLDLAERKYLRESTSGARIITDGNNYRGQLEIYFGDCAAASQLAQSAPFTAAGIAAVVQAYHTACTPALQPSRSWLDKATPRRRQAFTAGVLGGARYNRLSGQPLAKCVDCQLRPFAGLYVDLFQPGRNAALYGELSASTFENQFTESFLSTTSGVFTRTVDYRAWLGTARLGLRFFFPLPREQQVVLGFGYELNKVFKPRVSAVSGISLPVSDAQLRYASPAIYPNLSVGWRRQRVTLNLDGQLYTDPNNFTRDAFFSARDFTLRTSLAYRLSRNPDVAKPEASAQQH